MEHEIASEVTILKCVTPGSYWVRCRNCKGLCRIPAAIRKKSYSGVYYPARGEKVFVRDSEGFFYLGVICGRRRVPESMFLKYTIQLVHTFQVKDYDIHDIYPTFNEDSTESGSAHLVSLYHVLPMIPPRDYGIGRRHRDEKHSIFESSLLNWDKMRSEVEKTNIENYTFRFESVSVSDRSTYGRFWFYLNNKEIELKDFLAEKKIISRVTFRFETIVDSLLNNTIHQYKTLLPVVPAASPPQPSICSQPEISSDPPPSDINEYKIYEEDRKIHSQLSKQFSINILFNEPPLGSNAAVRFVSPDGLLVLGTVFTPLVNYIELVETDDEQIGNLSYHSYLNWQSCSIGEDGCGDTFLVPDAVESNSNECQNCLSYDIREAVTQFVRSGGVLQDHCLQFPASEDISSIASCVESGLSVRGSGSLKPWELACLPSILAKNNMLIVGPFDEDKISLPLICISSLLKISESLSSKNPKCLILVPNYEKATSIATLCKLISKFEVFVLTSSLSSPTHCEESLENCRIFITTPGHLCDVLKQYAFLDFNALTHVVYDSMDELNLLYEDELFILFRKIFLSRNTCVQHILLLNVWGSFIKDYALPLKVTRCLLDTVQTAFCHGLKPRLLLNANDLDLVRHELELNKCHSVLLLCKDDDEVQVIQENNYFLTEMLFIHEQLAEDEILEIVSRWKGRSGSALVCSDIVFNRLRFESKADILISWSSYGRTREILNQRLAACRDHPLNEWKHISLYIVCNPLNLEELAFIKKSIVLFKNCKETLNIYLDNSVKSLENQKSTAHCDNYCMFGECSEHITCPMRHSFSPRDQLNLPIRSQFVGFSLISVLNAFHYRGRIEKLISNGESIDPSLSPLVSNLKTIEDDLAVSFKSDIKVDNVAVHEVVGARIVGNKQYALRRVRILCVLEEVRECHVSILDYDEPDARVSLNALFEVPKKCRNYPKDVVDIYISKLLPSDVNSDWVSETKNICEKYLQNVEEIEFEVRFVAGFVELAFDRRLIVDDICLLGSSNVEFLTSLKSVYLENDLIKKNPDHIKLLTANHRKLNSTAEVDGRFGFRKNIPKSLTFARVSGFANPGKFFLQLDSEQNELSNFEDSFEKVMNERQRPLNVVALSELCAIKVGHSWRRVVILSVENVSASQGMTAEVLSVDYGVQYSTSLKQLFLLPDAFSSVPYFAIQCELAGILPNSGLWSTEDIKEFEQHILHGTNKCKSLLVTFCGVGDDSQGQYKHQVILSNPNQFDKKSINQRLVERKKASWNRSSAHLVLKYPITPSI